MAQFLAPISLPAQEFVFPGQGNRSDLVLDRVGVQLDGAVLKETDQAGPVRQGVADVLGQLRFLRDARELCFQPGLERGNDGCCVFAPGRKAQGRRLPSHGLFDPIEQRDLAQHLLGDG